MGSCGWHPLAASGRVRCTGRVGSCPEAEPQHPRGPELEQEAAPLGLGEDGCYRPPTSIQRLLKASPGSPELE